jgi:hypothetical protein
MSNITFKSWREHIAFDDDDDDDDDDDGDDDARFVVDQHA